MSRHHLAELHRHPCCRWARHRARGARLPEPTAGGVHPRLVRAALHPQLDAPVAFPHSMSRRFRAGMAAASGAIMWCWAASAEAHHEALFGPQSSLAIESEGFVSLQAHEHVFGVGSTYDQETSYIVSAGMSPFRSIPWSLTLVQAYTYENART